MPINVAMSTEPNDLSMEIWGREAKGDKEGSEDMASRGETDSLASPSSPDETYI